MAPHRALVGSLTAALLGGGAFVAAAAPSTAAGPPADDVRPARTERLLERTLPGPAARARLGMRGLQRAAEVNDLAPARLAELLEDRTTRLTPGGLLYYADVEHAESTTTDETAPLAASYPLSETFALNSRPQASRTIHLDFDGAAVSGTYWNTSWGGGLKSTTVAPFSLDGDRTTFNDNERRLVQEVWARVAEDFAPFDVNVTTTTPAPGDLTRTSSSDTTYGTHVLFAPGASVADALCGGGCAGIAWVDVFSDVVGSTVSGPAWVFTDVAGSDGFRLAEVASHEAGHTLSLEHDGISSSSYFSGQSPWGPIMGSSRYALSQWSNGDYSGADQQQDDVAAIAAAGAPALADDHADDADDAASATPLTATAAGVIGRRDDQDVFRIDHDGCAPTIKVETAAVGPNLDARLRVLDASGDQVASANPTLTQPAHGEVSGAGASLTLPQRPAGTLYAEVDGVGQGSTYSDYGSLGRYTVRVSGCGAGDPTDPTSTTDPTDPVGQTDPTDPVLDKPGQVAGGRAYSGRRGGTRTAKATWAAPSGPATVTGFKVKALKVRRSGKVVRTFHWTRPADLQAWEPRLPRGRYHFQVAAVNAAGSGAWSARSNRVAAR